MPTIRLTQLAADRLGKPAAGRCVYWDNLLPGFGLRITASGAKSWVAMYRVGGKAVLETLGTVAKVPKVDDARQLARSSIGIAAGGQHPVRTRKAAKARAAANTINAATELYLSHCDRDLRPKTAREWRRILQHDILPRWGERPLSEIGKADILAVLNDKASRRERRRRGINSGAGVQANKTLTRLRTFFRWCVDNDLVSTDPTGGVRKPVKETPRDRVLSDAELCAFWKATEGLGLPFGPLFRLLLLTAQRESEVAGMRWQELDERGTWAIPSERTKNGKPHIVHLSDLATDELRRVPRVDGKDLLFSRTGATPASGFSRAKVRLDERMAEAMGDDGALVPWTLHDLRRTATTGMAQLGIAPHVADRVLNHTAGTIRGVAAIYNQFQYLDERRAALAAWGRHVENLMRAPPSNVVPLAGAR